MRNLIKSVARTFGMEVIRARTVTAPYPMTVHAPGTDYSFWVANDVGRLWYDHPGHASNFELLALKELVIPGSRVLEVGCHHGFHTVFLSHLVGPSGTVTALEAEPGNALIAQAQVTLNRLSNCRVEAQAAGETTGTTSISLVDNVINGAGLKQEQVQVPMTTPDDIDRLFGPFDVLKVDVEGFETKVLRGARTILSRRPSLALELHYKLLEQAGDRLSDLLDLLATVRYQGSLYLAGGERLEYAADTIRSLASQHDKINLFLTHYRSCALRLMQVR